MESREAPQIPRHHHQHQQHNMILGGHSSAYSNITMINPNNTNNIHPTAGFPFNSQSKPPPSSSDCVGGGPFNGSSPPSCGSMRFSMESAKKKRGRPRKYTADGNIALGLSPTPISPSPTSLPQQQQHQLHQQHLPAPVDSGSAGGVASDPPSKRNRGRPPGSGKKQLDALGGVGGVGFTPHVIIVKAGEDIASKVMAFSQQGPRTVCILSANGAICNVTLRQPAMTGGTVTYEGRFEIISLSGSFLLSENCGSQGRTGGLSISLAGSDGRVLGGAVAGMLMAATPVQVIVGSFIAEGKKSNSVVSKYGSSSAPTSEMLNFAAPLTTASPPSQGASCESSDENGSSPLNRDSQIFSSATQPLHNMNMYHHQLWAAQNQH